MKKKKDSKSEMIIHLDNIISNIKNKKIKEEVVSLKEDIISKNIIDLDYKKVKKISNDIYDLNVNNDFSLETDYISNQYYAIEFLLEEELRRLKNGRKR